MKQVDERAFAKLNLSLDVAGKLPDGYHEMRMVMQSVDLCDEVSITVTESPGIRVCSNLHYLPNDERNIAWKAAQLFFSAAASDAGADIVLKKRIPVCAGMGGGSSDGAAVLRGLNRLFGAPFSGDALEELSRRLGSDVAFCVRGGTQLATGKGDILQPLSPLPDCSILICKPTFSISTPALFERIDQRRSTIHPDTDGILTAIAAGDLLGVSRRMYNVFEDVLPRKFAAISDIKSRMLDLGADGTVMTGTGSAVFGLFTDAAAAEAAHAAMAPKFRDCFLTRPTPALSIR